MANPPALSLRSQDSISLRAAERPVHPAQDNQNNTNTRNTNTRNTNTMKPTGHNAPSKKALIDALNITPEQAETVRGLIRGEIKTKDAARFPKANAYFSKCHHEPDRLTRILECLNEVLETHGVETIGEVRAYGPPAEYLNAGDTYTATLLFDHIAGNFKLASWGDWYERNENKAAFKNW